MKRLRAVSFILLLTLSIPARSDFWGGDIVVLSKILANAVQQLIQLRNILNTGKNNLELVRDINRGINDSLDMIKTLNPNIDPGIYRDWQKVDSAIKKMESIYGIAVDSPAAGVQRDLDQSVAEAITKNNSVYAFTKKVDQIGETIKSFSHRVSPGGAQKLTAQSLGVMVHVVNESLRTQATSLKLQAQTTATLNKQEKDRTRHVLQTSNRLKDTLKGHSPQFKVPRFN